MNNETDLILELLRGDGSFTTNKKLVKAMGLVEATLLCEIISYYFYIKKKERDKLSENQIYIDSDGWFEFSKKYCQETLNIKKCTLNSALVKLETLEVIHTKVKGSPARNFIKIDDNLPSKLALLLSNIQFAENSKLECRKQQTRMPKTANTYRDNTNNNTIIKNKQKEILKIKKEVQPKWQIETDEKFLELNQEIQKLFLRFWNNKRVKAQTEVSFETTLEDLLKMTGSEQLGSLKTAINKKYSELYKPTKYSNEPVNVSSHIVNAQKNQEKREQDLDSNSQDTVIAPKLAGFEEIETIISKESQEKSEAQIQLENEDIRKEKLFMSITEPELTQILLDYVINAYPKEKLKIQEKSKELKLSIAEYLKNHRAIIWSGFKEAIKKKIE